jgi:hypothetical protein
MEVKGEEKSRMVLFQLAVGRWVDLVVVMDIRR